MSRIFSSILIIPLFLICSELLPPTAHVEWNIIQNDEIWIGCTDYGDLQWCRAKSTLIVPMEKISTIIEDKANYPAVFKRVESVTIITDEIVHIVLDMPFPFNGRDYIVSYTQFQEEDDIIYRFNAVKDSGIPVHADYVRLIHAAGEWRLHSLSDDKTEVTYIWNGELLGTFPDWALTKAWETQGNEVLNWLKEAVQN